MTINFDIDDIFGILDPASFRALSSTNPAALVLHVVGTPLFVWVHFATAAKRLHDRNRSGWWMVVFLSCPVSMASSRTGSGNRILSACLALPRVA